MHVSWRSSFYALGSRTSICSTKLLRFQREAEAAGKLHHTNIVPIYATGEDDGTHYYAMELIDGPSLQQVIGNMRREQADDSAAAASRSDDEESDGQHVGLSTILNELPSWVTESFGGQADHDLGAIILRIVRLSDTEQG